MRKLREDSVYVYCVVEPSLVRRATEAGFELTIEPNVMRIKRIWFYEDLAATNEQLRNKGLKEVSFPYNNIVH